jgi:hypothetical protein
MTSQVSRTSQCGRILTLLADGLEHANGSVMTAGGGLVAQYGARLKELRRRGFSISLGRQDPDNASCWWYSWTDAEQRRAWLAGSTSSPQASAGVPAPQTVEPTGPALLRLRHPSRGKTRRRVIAASGSMRQVGAVLEGLNLFDGEGHP